MKCPVDKSDMIVVEYHNIELDHCLQCAGVWFDCGELELLLEMTNSQGQTCQTIVQKTPARVAEAKRKCPVCGRKMEKAWLGQKPRILIDSCPVGDGLWFDGGELHQALSQMENRKEENGRDILYFLGETFQAHPPAKQE
jgi:Zn-finger nucleic acid-binding protein